MGAKVMVKRLPDHKRDAADGDEMYDAGGAWLVDHFNRKGVPRETPKRDENGFPVIDDKRGTVARQRIRRDRAGLRMVTPAGVVVHSPMSNGSGAPIDPARRALVMARLHARGTIRYGTCPIRDDLSRQWLTKEQRKQTACEDGTYGENKACPHIEAIIAERKAKHAERERKANEKYKTIGEKQLDQDRQNVATLVAAMAARETLKPDG